MPAVAGTNTGSPFDEEERRRIEEEEREEEEQEAGLMQTRDQGLRFLIAYLNSTFTCRRIFCQAKGIRKRVAAFWYFPEFCISGMCRRHRGKVDWPTGWSRRVYL